MATQVAAPLLGKVAVVTGAGHGIEAVALEITETCSKATTFVGDVSERDSVFAAVDHASTALGGFDVMINNAGIALVGPIAEDHQRLVDRGPRGFCDAGSLQRHQVRGSCTHPGRRKEHAADGTTVNAYCRGVDGTDMWVEIDKRFAELTGVAEGETFRKFSETIALGRPETPQDVAGYVAYGMVYR